MASAAECVVAAGGVVFERCFEKRPALAETVGNFDGVARESRAHALRAFEYALGAAESILREIRGKQSIGRGFSRMQLFRIGGIAQEFPKPWPGCRRSRRRGASVRGRGARGDPRQPRRLRCRPFQSCERFCNASAPNFTHADANFVSGNGGGEQFGAGTTDGLRDRESRRENDGAGMKCGGVVKIVLFGEIRRGGVDHGGEEWRCKAARDQDLGFAGAGAHLLREMLAGFDRSRAFAGKSSRSPVQEKIFGAAQNRRGDVLEAEIGGKIGECFARVAAWKWLRQRSLLLCTDAIDRNLRKRGTRLFILPHFVVSAYLIQNRVS